MRYMFIICGLIYIDDIMVYDNLKNKCKTSTI